MKQFISRRSFLKGSAAAAAALTSPLLPADAASSETENGLFSPVSALCQTQYGPVKGREGENGQLCWYGIPYGAAPTGESRWTAPQEPARWLTVRDCTSPAPAAYQYTTFPLGTEDCLTLDIYSSAEAKKRPVLVYLHGSAATGSSLELPGSELVRDAGCVFVALNYRLGLFGWNCLPALTADPDATGNFALLDIARALDWVDTHTDREVAQAIIGQFPDTDLDTLEAVTARHREIGAWNMPLTMEKTALERLETVMTQAGELTEADWVDFDRLVDNHWAQAAR